jgi:hypothetical protein
MRTPEQVEADDALTAAIEGVAVAYEWHDGMLLTDYLVLTARQDFDAEGDSRTEYGYMMRDEAMPDYRIMGLLEVIRARFAYRHREDD